MTATGIKPGDLVEVFNCRCINPCPQNGRQGKVVSIIIKRKEAELELLDKLGRYVFSLKALKLVEPAIEVEVTPVGVEFSASNLMKKLGQFS